MPYNFFDTLSRLANRLDWQDWLMLGACTYLLAFLYLIVSRTRR